MIDSNTWNSKIGDTDISSVGTTITGAIANLDPHLVSLDLDNSSATSSNGTLTYLLLELRWTKNSVFVTVLDIRLKDLSANTAATLTIVSNDLTALPEFKLTVPVGIRGIGDNKVPTDGGQLYHSASSNTIIYYPFDYFASKPAGYLHIVG